MMTNDLNIRTDQITVEQLAWVLNVLDTLHDAASEGKLTQIVQVPGAEVVGLLQDILYTASETLREIKGATPTKSTLGWGDFQVMEAEGGLDA
jgi:hypothetical protein